MAETPKVTLAFPGGCPDCGSRRVELPRPLPAVEDDFDWLVRDYDGFRLFMMEELAARAPERKRWTPADMEVVIVEALAATLDRLSHALDVIAGERFLETARRPESVRRLLQMIGYGRDEILADYATTLGTAYDGFAAMPDLPEPESEGERIERYWTGHPEAMDLARRLGPTRILTQRRMVTLDDHARQLEAHPLVARARATSAWTGSWPTITVAVLLADANGLDRPLADLEDETKDAIAVFHAGRGVRLVDLDGQPTARTVLRPYVDAFRMAGREVTLADAVLVGISFALSVRVAPNFYRSEVLDRLGVTLGTGPGGFFARGRLPFGDDLYASDLIEAVMAVEGVETVCLNRFRRVGKGFPDRTADGRIVIAPDEIAVCDNASGAPERGFSRISAHGGLLG